MSRRKLFSLRFKKRSNPTKSLGYVAAHLSIDVSPIMKRSIRGGEKLEEVNYQQIFTVACVCPRFFSSPFSFPLSSFSSLFLPSFILVIRSSLHETCSLICCVFSPTALVLVVVDYIGKVCLCNVTKNRLGGKKK